MPVRIKELKNHFEISGELDNDNCEQVCKYFEILMEMKGNLDIDLSMLDSIDMQSVQKLNALIRSGERQGIKIRFIKDKRSA